MSTKRWSDAGSDASELERSLLASGLDAEPPDGAEQAVWGSLCATLGVPAPGGSGSALDAAARAPEASAAGEAGTRAGAAKLARSVTRGTLAKGFVLGIGVSLAVANFTPIGDSRPVEAKAPVGSAALAQPPPSPPPVNPISELPNAAESALRSLPSSATAPARRVPPVQAGPSAARPSQAAQAPSAASVAVPTASGGPPSPGGRLEEEAAMLLRARAELRAGRLAAAFATLEASREKFSFPELVQEREALLIELLYRSGERASAAEKSRAFLARYPESPHAARLRRLASAPP